MAPNKYQLQFFCPYLYCEMSRKFTGGGETGVEVNGYLVREKIGCGVFSTVFACHRIADPTEAPAAMKVYHAVDSDMKYHRNEGEIYNRLRSSGTKSQYVVECLDINAFVHTSSGSYRPRIFPYLVFVRIDTSLSKLMRSMRHEQNHTSTPIPQAGRFAREMMSGLEYLHNLGIIHADLKPSNIFMKLDNGEWHVVIGDLGTSAVEGLIKHYHVGTEPYIAPELMLAAPGATYTRAVDIWSAALIIYEMYTGEFLIDPFGECGIYYGEHIVISDAEDENADDTSEEFVSESEDENDYSEDDDMEERDFTPDTLAIIQTIIGRPPKKWKSIIAKSDYDKYYSARGRLKGFSDHFNESKPIYSILRDRALSPRTTFGKNMEPRDLESLIVYIDCITRAGLKFMPDQRSTATEYLAMLNRD